MTDTLEHVGYYSKVRIAAAIAQFYENEIAREYGEVWEIDFDMKFRFSAIDATVPDKLESHGWFTDADTLEVYLHSQFPKLAP